MPVNYPPPPPHAQLNKLKTNLNFQNLFFFLDYERQTYATPCSTLQSAHGEMRSFVVLRSMLKK